MNGVQHPMHPLVDVHGHITATGAAFVQRAGEIMDEAVTKAESRPPCWRSECRSGCYYPSACSERIGTSAA